MLALTGAVRLLSGFCSLQALEHQPYRRARHPDAQEAGCEFVDLLFMNSALLYCTQACTSEAY